MFGMGQKKPGQNKQQAEIVDYTLVERGNRALSDITEDLFFRKHKHLSVQEKEMKNGLFSLTGYGHGAVGKQLKYYLPLSERVTLVLNHFALNMTEVVTLITILPYISNTTFPCISDSKRSRK